jgi:hypothetical protein
LTNATEVVYTMYVHSVWIKCMHLRRYLKSNISTLQQTSAVLSIELLEKERKTS